MEELAFQFFRSFFLFFVFEEIFFFLVLFFLLFFSSSSDELSLSLDELVSSSSSSELSLSELLSLSLLWSSCSFLLSNRGNDLCFFNFLGLSGESSSCLFLFFFGEFRSVLGDLEIERRLLGNFLSLLPAGDLDRDLDFEDFR